MNDNVPSARSALRTLLIVLAVAVGIVVYAYGWNTTEISLEEVQDETRQASVTRAMRELLSPDLFERDRTEKNFTITFAVGCPEGERPDNRFETSGDAYLIIDPPCANVDEVIEVQGYNFPEGAIARFQLVKANTGQKLPFKLAERPDGEVEVSDEATFDIDGGGSFDIFLKVPKGRGLSGQTHDVNIQTLVPSGWPRFSDTTHTVIDKMIETIFLALMATTLALPVAVALSFIAARNLMRQVNLPLGVVLVGFILLPVGAVIGAQLLSPIGEAGIVLGKDLWPGLIAIPVAIGAFALASFVINYIVNLMLDMPDHWIIHLSRSFLNLLASLLLVIVMVFVLGVLGGTGIWFGEELQTGILNDLGNFIGTLGELVDLTIVAIAAVGFGFWLSSLGSTLAARPLRHVSSPLSNILGAVFGFISGGILLAITGYIGMQAVLLGILTPVVAAVLGGQIAVQLAEAAGLLSSNILRSERSTADNSLRLILFAVGAVAVWLGTAWSIDLIRAVVDQRLPAEIMQDFGLFSVEQYIVTSALIGAVLGGLAGGLVGTNTSFPLGMSIYNTSRTVLNTLRSIEPLIMGIVFVIWVGVGPFAGVLALTLHSIAALGKLYSEQVENIDSGPIEAIQSTGANRLQTIIYAVVPQIVPPYIAFTMYRWDINVRMSTIIGFVGGGGIGFLLQQQINLLRYKQAGVAVLAIAIVVSVLDYASAAIRERIV